MTHVLPNFHLTMVYGHQKEKKRMQMRVFLELLEATLIVLFALYVYR